VVEKAFCSVAISFSCFQKQTNNKGYLCEFITRYLTVPFRAFQLSFSVMNGLHEKARTL
jgi:hypothetical protein